MKTIVRLILALIFALGLSAQASLIAYEGFDSSQAIGTTLTNASVGVTGFGFKAYTNSAGHNKLQAGLTYSDSEGKSLVVSASGKSGGVTNVTAGTQNMQLALDSTINNSGTLYISYLLNVTDVSGFGYVAGLADGFVSSSVSPTAVMEAVFRSSTTFWGTHSYQNFDTRTGPAATTKGIFFVVSKLDMDSEVMTTWLNPTSLTNVSNTAAYTITSTSTGTWHNINGFLFSMGGTAAGQVDEIRIGQTIGDVTPVIPEPATIGMLGLGALATLLLRRMKSV